ncbi:MAG TPA: hypothetical protein VN285_09500 [Candidatus Deferrimicrobium sp.]|nr:hypothetical protein [Candidatus Deferrimicrobium sp.]
MTHAHSHRSRNVELRSNFIAAGTSAALLSLAHLWPELWFVSLFALVPFLWRLCKVNFRGAIILGSMLATFYGCATDPLCVSPTSFLLKLVAFNVIFVVFSLTIHRARKYIGFDPLFVALLWFPLEYVLIHYAGLETLFSVPESGPSLITGFCTLFGLLLGSLLTVLSNSLFLLIVKYLARWILSGREFITASGNKDYSLYDNVTLARSWYSFADVRAPPLQP